ncbi:MAG: DMT family transporter [Chloroflexota bacterium]
MNNKSVYAIGLMLLSSIWFGLQAWITQIGIRSSSALAFNTERYLIAAVAMGSICLITRAKFTKKAVFGGFAVGVAYAFTIGLESQALAYGAAGRVTFIGSLFVAFTPFLGYFLRSEKLYRVTIVGSLIMLIGAAQLLLAPNGSTTGDIYGILRAVACSLMLILVGHYSKTDWRVMCFVNSVTITLMSFLGAMLTGQTQFSLQTEVLIPVAVSGAIGSVGCFIMMTWAGRYISGAFMSVLFFMDSPFSVIWGVLLFKEVLSSGSVAAYLLIAIGAMLALTAGKFRVPSFNISLKERMRVKSITVN